MRGFQPPRGIRSWHQVAEMQLVKRILMTQSQSKLTLLPPNPPLSRSPKSRRPPPPPPPPPLPLVCSTRILLPSRSFPSRSLTTSSASRRSSNSANPNPSWKQNQCHSKVKRPRLFAPLIIFHLLIPWQRCSWFFHSPWGTSQYPWQELGQHLDVEIKFHLEVWCYQNICSSRNQKGLDGWILLYLHSFDVKLHCNVKTAIKRSWHFATFSFKYEWILLTVKIVTSLKKNWYKGICQFFIWFP